MNGKEEFDIEYNYDGDGKLVEKTDNKNRLKTCYIDGKSQVYKMDNGKDVFLYEEESNPADILPEAAKQDILVDGTDLTYKYEWNQNLVSEKYRLKDSGDIWEI